MNIGEENNVAEIHPEVVNEMRAISRDVQRTDSEMFLHFSFRNLSLQTIGCSLLVELQKGTMVSLVLFLLPGRY